MLTSSTVRRTAGRLILVILAGALSVLAAGFLIATLLLALLEVMPAPLATLATAGVLVLIAGILVLISRSRRRRRLPNSSLADELVPALHLAVGQKPWAAFAGAAVLGVVAEVMMKRSASQQRQD